MHDDEPRSRPCPTHVGARHDGRRAVALLVILAGSVGAHVAANGASRADAPIGSRGIRIAAAVEDTAWVPDTIAVSTTANRWKLGSVPTVGTTSVLVVPGRHPAELRWYSPYAAVKAGDLNPMLTDAQGAQRIVPALALSIPRRPQFASPMDSLWASLTYVLDPTGLDLSRADSIEVWVNDWRDPSIRRPGVRLHIDLGQVSEDQMRSPDRPPNLHLDSEDENKDLVLVPQEDNGMDGISDPDSEFDSLAGMRDLVTAGAADPEGDDYGEPDPGFREIDPRRWVRTNGTQGNRLTSPKPDTEDLNGNLWLDMDEDYWEYTIELGDPNGPYLATDVHRDFGLPADDPNGWRLYRIPIDAAERVPFGSPRLTDARHVRVWVEGLISPDAPPDGNNLKRPILMLGGMGILGKTTPRSTVGPRPQVWLSASPNPARESVTIDLQVSSSVLLDLTVYDLGGRRVRNVVEQELTAGRWRFHWDRTDGSGARVPPGLYLVQARGASVAKSAKVLLIE